LSAPRPILLGIVGRPHGVRGHVHVHSYAANPADLAAYGMLHDGAGRRFSLRWVADGIAELTRHDGATATPITDRAVAASLTNTRLYIDRGALPPPEPDEFYLADLVGLAARLPDGSPVGEVLALHDYGAGAFVEISGRDGAAAVLLPFTREAVPAVDLAAGFVVIDPPLELIDETLDAGGGAP
jgi:16S rRNA processing protein RimM